MASSHPTRTQSFTCDLDALARIMAYESSVFSDLVRFAGLRPDQDLRFTNLRNVNFAGSDLRGFNFTGANLSFTRWYDAIYDSTTTIAEAITNGALGLNTSLLQPTMDAKRKVFKQTTLRHSAELSGIGVHSGLPVTVTIHPADADTGIVFLRNSRDECEREIRADAAAVMGTEFATVLGDEGGPAISTVEHVMAALTGLGIDNALVELDGPEVPIMDGSAAPFVAAIDAAGTVTLPAARRYLRVLKPVGVVTDDCYGELRPHDGFRLEIEIDFDHPLVGKQSFALDVEPGSFRRHLARARTFSFTQDVAQLWSAGYALGATFENTVVVAEDRVLNPEGLRFPDEFVRHKALDALGDLALAGAPILGAYRSVRGSHRLNYAVLCALMADQSAWEMVSTSIPQRRAPKETQGRNKDVHADLQYEPG